MSRLEMMIIVFLSFLFGFMSAVCLVDDLERFEVPFTGKVFERVYSQKIEL